MSLESAKACLPHGWVVKTSMKYPDRVYYFNLFTGCSTWECPELTPKRMNDRFKELAAKKNLSRASDSEHESAGRFSANIHTPEESPQYSQTSKTYNATNTCNTNRKSQKRPFEVDLTSQRENVCKVLKPPTAIVTPVIPDHKKKLSTSVSIPSEAPKPKRKKKSKAKNKNKLIPQAVVNASIPNKKYQCSLVKPSQLNLKKETSLKSKLSTGPDKPSTSTAESFQRKSIDSGMKNFGPSGFNPIVFSSEKTTTHDFSEDNSFEDVEMIDVSANLTSVEEVVATAKESNQPLSHYIVIDTNILVHELNHIDELKDTPLQGCGPPHIIIPWVVVKELDGLKSSSKGIGKLACSAVRYLHKILKLKHPRFHGQSAKEAEECKQSYHDNNDDRIIDCCHSLRAKMPPEKVILMTNDKNLANKAMIYGIIVHDWTSLLKDLKPDISIQASSSQRKKMKKKETDPLEMRSQKNLERRLLDERNAYETEIDNVMDKARQLLKDVLDPILAEEMTRVYGDKWRDFNIDRRLLREILAAYIKFWDTIFCFVIANKAKSSFELLHKKLISQGGLYNTLEKCLEILYAITDIFGAIRRPPPNMSTLMKDIQILTDTCTYIFTKCHNVDSSLSIIESSIKEIEEQSALEVFNHNWTVVNDLCGMAMDFFGVQHTFVYNRQECIPPESEYRRVVADLYPYLLQLRQLMKKMLVHVQDSTPNKTVFKKLYSALRELVPSLNIKFIMPNMTNFTTRALESFCRNPANRQRVEFGCKQLDNYCDKLKEAIQVMVSRKSLVTSSVQVLKLES